MIIWVETTGGQVEGSKSRGYWWHVDLLLILVDPVGVVTTIRHDLPPVLSTGDMIHLACSVTSLPLLIGADCISILGFVSGGAPCSRQER